MVKTRFFRALASNPKLVAVNALICALTIALAVDPKQCIASVHSALGMFVQSVLPALLPYFFFTKLLTSLGAARAIGDLFRRPVALLYNAPPIGGYVCLMSLLSGYPVGARLLGDLYKAGVIDGADARCISSFASTSGPLFVVGTVGTAMFGSPRLGYALLACHVAGALLNGLLYRRRKTSMRRAAFVPPCTDNVLASAMTDSILSVALVGGYIAVFGLAIDLLISTGILGAIASPLAKLLFALGQDPRVANSLAAGAIELTRGCKLLSEIGLESKTALPYLAGMLSFGGVAIAVQSLSFCSVCGIRIGFFALTKATQAAITISLACLVSLVL